MKVESFLGDCQERVNAALQGCLPALSAVPARLHEAMRYSVLNGGKRLRPLLVYATGFMLAIPFEQLDAPACAVELIHAYSLIHDDLPAMDDDDLRRGKPTCHKAFDEATAILAGDALQTLAFHIIATQADIFVQPKQCVAMLTTLTEVCGSKGMTGGQMLDLAATGQILDVDSLEFIHQLKTGALIRASVRLAGLVSGATSEADLAMLDTFAMHIGLAFQIQDDILDIESSTAVLGKQQGADRTLQKMVTRDH